MATALTDRPTIYRFSIDEYHRLIETGVLNRDARVELVDGVLVEKIGQNPPHSSAIRKLLRVLNEVLPDTFIASPQLPITLTTSEPEPDIAIVRGPESRYDDRHPGPANVALVIEVADRSVLSNRNDKARIYAAAKIAAYWIVNLSDRVVEVRTDPRASRPARYASAEIYDRDQPVPLILKGRPIADISFRDILS